MTIKIELPLKVLDAAGLAAEEGYRPRRLRLMRAAITAALEAMVECGMAFECHSQRFNSQAIIIRLNGAP